MWKIEVFTTVDGADHYPWNIYDTEYWDMFPGTEFCESESLFSGWKPRTNVYRELTSDELAALPIDATIRALDELDWFPNPD